MFLQCILKRKISIFVLFCSKCFEMFWTKVLPHVANGKWVGQRWPSYMKTIKIIHKNSCEYRHCFFLQCGTWNGNFVPLQCRIRWSDVRNVAICQPPFLPPFHILHISLSTLTTEPEIFSSWSYKTYFLRYEDFFPFFCC